MAVTVLHVIESMRPEAGSVAISLSGLFIELADNDVNNLLVTADAAPVSGDAWSASSFDERTSATLVGDADVVHVHGWDTASTKAMASAARRAGKPYIISPGGALTHGPYRPQTWRGRMRGVFGAGSAVPRGAAVITAVNGAEESDLRAQLDHPRVERLEYGLTFADYAADQTSASVDLPPKGERRELLVLGPIAPVEGCVPLLKALAELGAESDDWNIVFAGRDTADWRAMLEAAVQRKGGGDRVLFAEASDVATQRAWLTRADAVACPALHVRVGVSILQALAAGVPCVASNQAAPDGLNGAIRVHQPGRARLREALQATLRMNDNDRAEAVRKAREAGARRFDWSVLAKDYTRLYRELA